MKNVNLKKYILFFVFIIISCSFVILQSTLVNAEDSRLIIGDNTWKLNTMNQADGTIKSQGADGFIVNMSSIGSSDDDNDAVVSLSGLNLEANKKYVYMADIKSNNVQRNLYLGIHSNGYNGTQLIGSYDNIAGVNVSRFVKLYSPTKNIPNASIVYKIGKNGYEGNLINNQSNIITVTNSKVLLYNDYIKDVTTDLDFDDFYNMNYSSLDSYSTDDGFVYRNYAYKFLNDVDGIQNDKKIDSNLNNIYTISFPTNGGIGVIKEIYLNGKKISPNNLTDNDISEDYGIKDANWVHIPYKLLNKDYNYIVIVSETARTARLVVKNGEILNLKTPKINAINSLIEKVTNEKSKEELNTLLDKLKKATTNDKIDAIVVPDEETVLINDFRYNIIDNIKSYQKEDNSDLVKEMLNNAIDEVNDDSSNSIAIIEGIYNKYFDSETGKVLVQLAKDNFVSELEKYTGKYDSVDKIYKKYKDIVDSLDNVPDVSEQLNKALNEIEDMIKIEESKIDKIDNPATGDTIFRYILAFLISVVGFIVVFRYSKTIKN